MTIWKVLLGILSIFQIVLAIMAEMQEDYLKASYEMLWLFFFMYLLHQETKK